MLLALDGEDSPYLRKRCLLKDADAPVGEQVQKLFVLDKNNMATPETADAEWKNELGVDKRPQVWYKCFKPMKRK